MLNLGKVSTGRYGESAHSHPPGLIMHWIDVCTDPAVHRVAGGSPVDANSVTHRDQLVAKWIEPGATLLRNAM